MKERTIAIILAVMIPAWLTYNVFAQGAAGAERQGGGRGGESRPGHYRSRKGEENAHGG